MSFHEDLFENSFCIFRNARDLFACPAHVVRSVVAFPEVTTIPWSDRSLLGLAYTQKEFRPIFDLARLQNNELSACSSRQLLTFSVDDAEFGLAVDQVVGLDQLETTYSVARSSSHEWGSVIVGSASYRDEFVSIIDPDILAMLLTERLSNTWHEFENLVVAGQEQ